MDRDVLVIMKYIINRSLFDAIGQVSQEKAQGWVPLRDIHLFTNTSLGDFQSGTTSSVVVQGNNVDHVMWIVISQTGVMYQST
jgi:hypothetical protein